MTELERLAVIVGPDTSVDATIRLMAERSKKVVHAGIAVVLDEEKRVRGMVTDGDIRRAYAKDLDFSLPVTRIMVADPITVPASLPVEDVVPEVYRRVQSVDRLTSEAVRHVLVTDGQSRLIDIYDFLELLHEQDYRSVKVAVFGMGYVGLILAVALANRGHIVTAIENKADLAAALGRGVPHIHEPGLEDMLRVSLAKGTLDFTTALGNKLHRIYIVAVGSPLAEDQRVDLSTLEPVGHDIARLLKRADLVMLRSTVPAGTTRNFFVPLLEEGSGLAAGEDFHVAFTPERSVEGEAMREMRSLPQIVGGLTPRSTRRAADFWATLTPSVIQVPSLEAAELIKLANNTFRDLSFGFANELALLADRYNLDAFELIEAANEGYPRSRIPSPSPGVGGYCLTKDPFLFGRSPAPDEPEPKLGVAGRCANQEAAQYPIQILERYAERTGRSVKDLHILMIGIAFKGEPETNDVRGSIALEIGRKLRARAGRVSGWDAVVDGETIAAEGVEPVSDLTSGVAAADAVLILNNHRHNVPPGVFSGAASTTPKLIFDGWSLLDSREIEQMPGFVYATMGYMTPRK